MAPTQVISKPCLPKRGENRAGEVGKRHRGDQEQMLQAGWRGDREGW